jgi:hypothetical protein
LGFGEKGIVDRVDKVLLVLPLLPAADLVSTVSSLRFGGEEIGILARPILQHYGIYGLVMLTISASIMFLVFMKGVIYIRKLFMAELKFKWKTYILAIPIYWFFMLQGVYVSTIIMNFLVPIPLLLTEPIVLKVVFACTYFVGVSALTMPQMKNLLHF